jgi:spore germination cell wall hydrolase CwlJ-like protein
MIASAKSGLMALVFCAAATAAQAEMSLPTERPIADPATLPAFASAVTGAPAAARRAPIQSFDDNTLTRMVASLTEGTRKIDAQLQCLADVVYHEARDRDLKAQLAVAEVVDNRVRSGRFADTVCNVVNQKGQFFPTASYKTPTASLKWRTAVAVAQIARERMLPGVTAGALFYHAASSAPLWRHDRLRVAEVGGNVFYR